MDVTESYRILELEIGASRAAVDAAYCRLVEKWHPDRAGSGGPEAVREAQRMVESINDAYHLLAKIAPTSIKPPEALASHNPERRSVSRIATAASAKSANRPSANPAPIAAPKTKPKLPPMVGGQPSSSSTPPPPPPPGPETWSARPPTPFSAPIPSTPAPTPEFSTAKSPSLPVAPISPLQKSPTPSQASSPPPFSPPPPAPPPNFPAPVSKSPPVAPIPPPPASPADVGRTKIPGLYDSLFPLGSPLRRFGPLILIAVVVVLLLLGKCATSSSSTRKSAQGPDPKTTGRLVAKSNLSNVTIAATKLAAPGDVTTATFSGTTDQALSGLPPGKYAVTAHAEGWPEVREEAVVDAERTTDLMINFKGGSLRLESDPAGATVRLGAAVLGRTPLVIPQLPPGPCQLSLEYPTWPSLLFKTNITESVESTGSVRFPYGKLTVETSPPGTTVSLGKRVLGQTPLTMEQFPAGTRKLTLQAKDFPPLELAVTLEDHGEVKLHPALGSAFPVLDPAALLRAFWVPDNPDQIAPPNDGVTGPFQSRNGIVKNINRKRLFEAAMNRRFRFSSVIKSYDQASGRIEFTEQQSELSKYRVLAILSPGSRNDPDLTAQLIKGASFVLYGRLTAVEEPRWPSKVITIELSAAEPLR